MSQCLLGTASFFACWKKEQILFCLCGCYIATCKGVPERADDWAAECVPACNARAEVPHSGEMCPMCLQLQLSLRERSLGSCKFFMNRMLGAGDGDS